MLVQFEFISCKHKSHVAVCYEHAHLKLLCACLVLSFVESVYDFCHIKQSLLYMKIVSAQFNLCKNVNLNVWHKLKLPSDNSGVTLCIYILRKTKHF